MRTAFLAIDVGGSTTRAYLVDHEGRCLGQGRNRGGNPASNNPEFAAASMIAAVEAAIRDAGGEPMEIVLAQIALAGPQKHVAVDTLETAFRRMGLTGPVVFAGDLLAMFASVTPSPDGYCVVCGTGAGAVRVRGGVIEQVADAAGWLLGDLGSGYWLGHEAAKAVVAELDGRGPATALTPALLSELGIPLSEDRAADSRLQSLRTTIDTVYALRPIELARFAPLVIAHRNDAVAAGLIAQAERYLVADFVTVFERDMPGPVALGGGVMPHLTGAAEGIAEVMRAAGHAPEVRLVADGSVGAVILAMHTLGIAVDETMFQTIAASIAERRTGAVAG